MLFRSARAVCAVCSCGLSSACACSGPCLLRVPVLCVLGLCAQPRRDVTCAGDATELCVEKGITLGIHVHTSTMNASGHSTGNPVSSAVSAVHACTRMLSPFSPRATCPSQLLRVCHHTDRVWICAHMLRFGAIRRAG